MILRPIFNPEFAVGRAARVFGFGALTVTNQPTAAVAAAMKQAKLTTISSSPEPAAEFGQRTGGSISANTTIWVSGCGPRR